MKQFISAFIAFSLVLLAGCSTSVVAPIPYPDNKVKENYPVLQGMPISQNHTPYSPSLMCLSEEAAENTQYLNQYRHTITVDNIKDLTGKYDYESGGYKVTQGSSNMVTSALMKTNAFRVVDRNSMAITELERALANNKLVREYDFQDNQRVREVVAGEVIGSDYKIVGAITELNYDIDSSGYDATVAGWGSRARRYVSNVAIDLFLVDTRSTEVVAFVSVKKQLVGFETRHGVFRFFNDNLFDIGIGEKKQEPMQLAVRAAIEHAVWDFTSHLYGAPSAQCQELKNAADGVMDAQILPSGNPAPAENANAEKLMKELRKLHVREEDIKANA